MSTRKTQEDAIIERLRADGKVSRNWALQNYISRLSAIICDLAKDGWVFESRFVKENGGKNFYYYLKSQPYEKVVRHVPQLGKTIVTYERISKKQ